MKVKAKQKTKSKKQKAGKYKAQTAETIIIHTQ
jgi:hypothetical protein